MEREEIILRRLSAQHLLRKTDTQTAVKDLCGVQVQSLSHALHGLSIRCGSVNTESLVKSWTNRGMTESESTSAFDPWDGLIRALCEDGRICHKVQEKKAYRFCPSFEPMDEIPAQLELARRCWYAGRLQAGGI